MVTSDKNNPDNIHKEIGPLLLLAGPGTGKTYRLAKRIKYLVEDINVPPEEITVITFTAAAAKNMRDRISDTDRSELYVKPQLQPKSIRTMHSLGYKILQDEKAKLPFKCDYVVTSPILQKVLCEDASQLSGMTRNKAEETLNCRQIGDCKPAEDDKCKICKKYKKILRSCNAIDYDDQILLACRILRENPDLLKNYQDQCRHMLIDEYQDINAAQFDLIKLLSKNQVDGLFVVGDDDQSIYSWRGGRPEFIRRFKKYFGTNAKVRPLQVSFRCHKHILEGATSIISKYDADRIEKGPFTYKVKEGKRIEIHSVASDEKEAREILSIIKESLPSNDVLILVPHKGFADAIAKELAVAKIPFSFPPTIHGEGLQIIANLAKWLSNPVDSLSFRLCLQYFLDSSPDIPSKRVRKPEKKHVRDQILKNISELWLEILAGNSISLWECLQNSQNKSPIIKQAYEKFSKIVELSQEDSAGPFAEHIIESLGIWKKASDLMLEMEEWVSSFERLRPQDQGASVRIMTLQGAKGLEANVVCVLGVEEGTLPRNSDDPERLAEEARLFYVSATRAINELHIFCARKRTGSIVFRNLYDSGGPPDLQPSRFIKEISKDHKRDRYHRA